MIAVVCVDDRGGMAFNRRRQSMDRLLRADLIKEAGGRTLWMSEYSQRQFAEEAASLRTAERFWEEAGGEELCFFERLDPAPWLGEARALVVYRWNRRYPADLYFSGPPEGWKLARREEFPGSSHEKITKEVYVP